MSPPLRHPKDARIRLARDFARLLAEGEVFPGRQCLVRRRPNEVGAARLGIATPRRYGKSVRRNRFRRLVREAFRLNRQTLGAYDYLVSPRKGLEEPDLAQVVDDLLSTRSRKPLAPKPRRRPAPGKARQA